MGTPDRTLAAVWKAENWLRALQDHVNTYRLPALITSALIFAFALAAYISRHRARIEWLFGWFQRYQKIWKRLLLITSAFASFTIFSGVVPSLHATIEARVRRLSDKYAEYARSSEAVTRQATTTEIIRRALRESTADWRGAVQLRAALDERLNTLDQRLRYIHHMFGVDTQSTGHEAGANPEHSDPRGQRARGESSDPNTARQWQRSPSGTAWEMPPAGTFESEQRKGDAVGHDSPEMPPDAAAYSESDIDARLSTLRRFTDRLTAQAVELCNTQLGSKLPGELIGQILSAKRWRAFAAIASEYPLIEALVSVLEKSATETFAARVKKAAEKARKQPSANLEDAVQEEARASAASAVIEESELAKATTRFREQTENEEKVAAS